MTLVHSTKTPSMKSNMYYHLLHVIRTISDILRTGNATNYTTLSVCLSLVRRYRTDLNEIRYTVSLEPQNGHYIHTSMLNFTFFSQRGRRRLFFSTSNDIECDRGCCELDASYFELLIRYKLKIHDIQSR